MEFVPLYLIYYLFSPLSFFILGLIIGLLNNTLGKKKFLLLPLFGLGATLLYYFVYLLLVSPYVFMAWDYFKKSYVYVQISTYFLTLNAGVFAAILLKHIIRKQILSSAKGLGVEIQPREEPHRKMNIWIKITIIFLVIALLVIAGYLAYKRIISYRSLMDQQNQYKEKIANEQKKIRENDSKYFSQKISTIFAIGGKVPGEMKGVYPESDTVEYYSPKDNTWKSAPSLGTARFEASAIGAQNKIYVFGGSTLSSPERPLNSVEEFDAKRNIWVYKNSMSEGRKFAATAYLRGKIYLIGGQGNSYKKLNSVEIYDPQSDRWTSGPAMPGTVITDTPLCGALGLKIYCLGVAEGGYSLVLNVETNLWEKVGTENRSRTMIGTGTTVGNKIISVVSRPPEGTYLSTYSYITDSFLKEPLSSYAGGAQFPKVINNFGVVSIGDYMVVVGGNTSSGPISQTYGMNTSYPKEWLTLASLKIAREGSAVTQLPMLYGVSDKTRGSIGGTSTPNVKMILVTTREYYTYEKNKKGEMEKKTSIDFGNKISETYADSAGRYIFTDVPAGKYQVGMEDLKNPGSMGLITQYLPEGKMSQSFELKPGEIKENYNYTQ